MDVQSERAWAHSRTDAARSKALLELSYLQSPIEVHVERSYEREQNAQQRHAHQQTQRRSSEEKSEIDSAYKIERKNIINKFFQRKKSNINNT